VVSFQEGTSSKTSAASADLVRNLAQTAATARSAEPGRAEKLTRSTATAPLKCFEDTAKPEHTM
jgi:hypothetical protein